MWLVYKTSVPKMYNYRRLFFRTMKCVLAVKAKFSEMLTHLSNGLSLMFNVWRDKKKKKREGRKGLTASFYILLCVILVSSAVDYIMSIFGHGNKHDMHFIFCETAQIQFSAQLINDYRLQSVIQVHVPRSAILRKKTFARRKIK